MPVVTVVDHSRACIVMHWLLINVLQRILKPFVWSQTVLMLSMKMTKNYKQFNQSIKHSESVN